MPRLGRPATGQRVVRFDGGGPRRLRERVPRQRVHGRETDRVRGTAAFVFRQGRRATGAVDGRRERGELLAGYDCGRDAGPVRVPRRATDAGHEIRPDRTTIAVVRPVSVRDDDRTVFVDKRFWTISADDYPTADDFSFERGRRPVRTGRVGGMEQDGSGRGGPGARKFRGGDHGGDGRSGRGGYGDGGSRGADRRQVGASDDGVD